MTDTEPPRIEWIKPPAEPAIDTHMLTEYLHRQRIRTEHGQAFTGRPSTEIIETPAGVIKFRTEYTLSEYDARRFIEKNISREAQLQVHHPHKAWFLLFSADADNSITIANITPYLTPLHQLDSRLSAETFADFLQLVHKLIEQYVITAKQYELSIDLSLSNFGVDANNNIYYLDDECYRWRQFQELPEFLANLIRSLDYFDTSLITQLGNHVRQCILEHYHDAHWLTVIAEGLRNVFIPEARENLRQQLVRALYAAEQFTYTVSLHSSVIALIADIHANAPALETALSYLAQRDIRQTLVLGDIVGYGPHPQQCIDILRQQSDFFLIRGNHDHAVASGNRAGSVSSLAAWALNWTIEALPQSYKQWLAALPCYLQNDLWLAVHGSPRDKTFFNGYVYQMNYTENLDELQQRDIRLCFHGHTHIQNMYYRQRGVDQASQAGHNDLQTLAHALICPGSIGQPRCGIPGIELAIIDTEQLSLEFVRLNYDIELTMRDMAQQQFPEDLIERLRNGQ